MSHRTAAYNPVCSVRPPQDSSTVRLQSVGPGSNELSDGLAANAAGGSRHQDGSVVEVDHRITLTPSSLRFSQHARRERRSMGWSNGRPQAPAARTWRGCARDSRDKSCCPTRMVTTRHGGSGTQLSTGGRRHRALRQPFDVAAAVRFAAERTLRSGYAAAATACSACRCRGGLMVDLSLLRSVRVDPDRRRAWVAGGGAGRLDRASQPSGSRPHPATSPTLAWVDSRSAAGWAGWRDSTAWPATT